MNDEWYKIFSVTFWAWAGERDDDEDHGDTHQGEAATAGTAGMVFNWFSYIHYENLKTECVSNNRPYFDSKVVHHGYI